MQNAIIQFETKPDFDRGPDAQKALIDAHPDAASLFSQFPGIGIEYRYSDLGGDLVERLLLDARGAPDSSFHPDLCFTLSFGKEDVAKVLQALTSHPKVVSCEMEVDETPEARAPLTSNNTSFQNYFEDYPAGNDLFSVAGSVSNARGEGLRVFTIGYDFWRDHPEFKNTRHPIVTPQPLYGSRRVGTPFLAVLAASLGQASMTGGLPWAEHYVLPASNPSNRLVVDQSIMEAIRIGGEGDIIVIASWAASVNGFSDVPVECAEFIWKAIRKATDLGFVVVEPAGDGGRNLDGFVNANNEHVLDPMKTTEFRDSGAVMVGSSKFVPGTGLTPSDKTNRGGRIDAFADGTNIVSAEDDPSTPGTGLYNGFSGNQYSTAVVAAAVGVVQSAFKGTINVILPGNSMRWVVGSNGKYVKGIGSHPRLRNVLPSLFRVFDDVYLRDFVGDDGSRHNRRQGLSSSPDIVIRSQPYTSAQAAIGHGSGQENNNRLSQPVRRGRDSYIYLRGLNRSRNDAQGVLADMYYAKPSVLTTPDKWNRIGQAHFDSAIPAGDKLQCSRAYRWNTANIASGHYCFVAIIYSVTDRPPNLGAIGHIADWVDFISSSNNVAWRNFDVVGKAPNVRHKERSEHPVDVGVRFPVSLGLKLEVTSNLPARAYVGFEIPAVHAGIFQGNISSIDADTAWLEIDPDGTQTLIEDNEVPRQLDLTLVYQDLRGMGDDGDNEEYEVYLRYLFNGIEIGRRTWIISSLAEEPDEPDQEAKANTCA
ncbi:hypothetical protein [Maricaulis sp.]|uniref:hypothetical protein n=1 Tax=Maricaulis sp. TaxID=1486257 RepID=UPI00261B360A|nr:hypothetical protein [Maricaulis sp.]